MITNIAIVGVGLIGGSIGLALKSKAETRIRITGIDSCQRSIEEAIRLGAIDDGGVTPAAAALADMVFLCTPVLQIRSVVQSLLPVLKPGTIITDVGSTKRQVVEELKKFIPPDIVFIGGHPMAGREKSSITAADKDLFQDKWYIVSSGIHAAAHHYDQLKDIIHLLGAKIVEIEPDTHDHCAAYVSHIPHVAAAALVNLLKHGHDPGSIARMIGGGFRDTTRIASSNADMWADVCITNAKPIMQGLSELQSALQEVIEAMETGDRNRLYHFFREAKTNRDELLRRGDTI
jgi:prephenate dehydrogenase